MTITADEMKALKKTAADAFKITVKLKITPAEGVAILMESGLTVSGYTQPKGMEERFSNAAGHALSAVWLSHANEIIKTVLIVTENEDIQPSTLNALKTHLAVVKDGLMFHAHPCATIDCLDISVQNSTPIPRF